MKTDLSAVARARRDLPLPRLRPRRLRRSPALRRLVAEHSMEVGELVEPVFVVPGYNVRAEISSLPGIYRQSVDRLLEDAKAAEQLGIPALLLFGVPETKDELASELTHAKGTVQRAIAELKRALPGMILIADLCACEYTSHGHCGILGADGVIDNDRTVALLAQGALSYASCGADVIAPSDMMDGRVRAIRQALDDAGLIDTCILSYAVKYASAFYGPFREAAGSAPLFGDRRTHQMDPPNVREALKEARLDVLEGADMLLVKPALAYLDVLYRVKRAVEVPVAVYNVSGEYAMLKAAAAKGWIDEERAIDEVLLSLKRAGADFIISYFARAFAARRAR